MKEWINKLTKEERLTIVGVFLTIFGSYFGYSGLDKKIRVPISAIISLIGGIILLIQDIGYYKQGLYTEKQKKILATLAMLGLIVVCREDSLYLSLVIAANFIHKDLKQLMKIIFYSSVISFVLICLLCLVGLIPNATNTRGMFGTEITKMAIGFSHPNVTTRFFFGILLIGLFVCKDRVLYGLISLLLGTIAFFITWSRAGIIATIAFFIICLIPRKITNKVFKLNYIPYLFIIFTLISVVCALFMHDGRINELSSGRFGLWYGYIKEIGVFAKIERIGGPLDNMFVNTMYYGGMYGYIYYFVIYLLAFSKIKKNNDTIFIIALTTFICGFFENFSGYGESKFLLISLILILNENKIEELQEKHIQKVCQ